MLQTQLKTIPNNKKDILKSVQFVQFSILALRQRSAHRIRRETTLGNYQFSDFQTENQGYLSHFWFRPRFLEQTRFKIA